MRLTSNSQPFSESSCVLFRHVHTIQRTIETRVCIYCIAGIQTRYIRSKFFSFFRNRCRGFASFSIQRFICARARTSFYSVFHRAFNGAFGAAGDILFMFPAAIAAAAAATTFFTIRGNEGRTFEFRNPARDPPPSLRNDLLREY